MKIVTLENCTVYIFKSEWNPVKSSVLTRMVMLSSSLLAVALFSTSPVNATQTDHSLNFSGISLLKINDYDVLYCVLVGPYTNEENLLMAPLRSVSELLGAKAKCLKALSFFRHRKYPPQIYPFPMQT